MIKLFVLLTVIGLAVAVFKFLAESKADQPEEGTYEKRKILTEAEQSFYQKLKELVADRYYIFPQVHLESLVRPKTVDRKLWRKLWNKVIQKSVDFVLVDKLTFHTKLVIELDDNSHLKDDRVRRDYFVNKVLASTDIPFVRVKGIKEFELMTRDTANIVFDLLNP